jgi:hypothetical protein
VRITSALLADFASVREGLLFVVGGGLSVVRADFPVTMSMSLGLVLQLQPNEAPSGSFSWPVQVTVRRSRKVIGAMTGRLDGTVLNPGLPSQVAVAVDLRVLTLPQAGPYTIAAKVGSAATRLRLDAMPREVAAPEPQ